MRRCKEDDQVPGVERQVYESDLVNNYSVYVQIHIQPSYLPLKMDPRTP